MMTAPASRDDPVLGGVSTGIDPPLGFTIPPGMLNPTCITSQAVPTVQAGMTLGSRWVAAWPTLRVVLVLVLVVLPALVMGLAADDPGRQSRWSASPAGLDGLGNGPALASDPLASLALDLAEHLNHTAAPDQAPPAPLHEDLPRNAISHLGEDGQGSEPCAAAPRSTEPLSTVRHPAPPRADSFASAPARQADRPPRSDRRLT